MALLGFTSLRPICNPVMAKNCYVLHDDVMGVRRILIVRSQTESSFIGRNSYKVYPVL